MKRPKPTKRPPTAELTDAEPPDWLSKYGVEVWHRTLKDLAEAGRPVDRLNREAFVGFCDAAGLVAECSQVLAAEGMTIDGGREGKKRHPAVTTRISALNSLRAYAAELGLTPASSGRLPEPTGKRNRYPQECIDRGDFTAEQLEQFREAHGRYPDPSNPFEQFRKPRNR